MTEVNLTGVNATSNETTQVISDIVQTITETIVNASEANTTHDNSTVYISDITSLFDGIPCPSSDVVWAFVFIIIALAFHHFIRLCTRRPTSITARVVKERAPRREE